MASPGTSVNRALPRLLLTGPPGCGKTTVLRRTVELLIAPGPPSGAAATIGQQPARMASSSADITVPPSIAGFFTQEIREHGRRLGFEAIGLRGSRAVLAHVDFRGRQRVGRYGVNIEAFESFLRQELTAQAADAQLVVIDEIGKMECFSSLFVRIIGRLLQNPAALLATVAAKGPGLIAAVKSRPDVELLTVSPTNRDQLPQQLAQRLRKSIAQRLPR